MLHRCSTTGSLNNFKIFNKGILFIPVALLLL